MTTYVNTCAACACYQRTDDKTSTGICRRYAPRPVTGPGSRLAAWPIVHMTDWCWEFIPVTHPSSRQRLEDEELIGRKP